MAGSGTGYPLTLRCAKCKVGDFRYIRRGTKLEATGRVKVLKYHRRLARSQGRLMDGFQTAEYRCLDCGHVGWSRHKTMLRLLEKLSAGKRAARSG